MKILHIGKYYYPFFGGMETVLRDLCENTQKEDFAQVRVLCSNTSLKSEFSTINGVEVYRVARFGTLFSQPLCLTIFIHALIHSRWADVIHIHSPNPLVEFLSLFLRKPIVTTHHSDIVKQGTLKKVYFPFFKLFIKKIKKIIVPTKNHIEYSSMIKQYSDKHSIIPFGLKEDTFEQTEDVKKCQAEIIDRVGDYFLFVGRLVEYKGVEYLIKAMKDVPTKLIIIGEGPLRKNLQELVSKESLQDKVQILGRVESGAEFFAYYYSCRAVVLPSITPNENFGMIQLEAMKCKKPIITTRLNSGVPVVAQEGVSSLLVDPRNCDQLAEAMNTLHNDKAKAEKMGLAAFDRFISKYQMKIVIQKHLDLYKELLVDH